MRCYIDRSVDQSNTLFVHSSQDKDVKSKQEDAVMMTIPTSLSIPNEKLTSKRPWEATAEKVLAIYNEVGHLRITS